MPVYLKTLKFIVSRAVVFYLVCFLIVWRMLDYHALINNGIPQTLSRLTPPIDYFAEFVHTSSPYDPYKLMDCVNYHKAVAQFFPYQKAEAFGMLGYCYERLGETAKAIDAWQQAIRFNPDYFWPYYNLGVVFYKQGNYKKAGESFRQAIEQNPVKTIVLLSRSKVYNDVRLSKMKGSYDYLQGIKDGRLNAYLLLMDSLFKSGDYPQLAPVAIDGLKEGLGKEGLFYFYLGVSAFYQQSLPKAVEFLKTALQYDPRNADAYYYLGQCLKMAGQQDAAQIFLGQASELHQQGISLIKPSQLQVQFF